MKVEILTFCDSAEDLEGRLNVLATYDRIRVPSTPFLLPETTIAVRLRFWREEGRLHSLSLRLMGPDGQILTVPTSLPVQLKGEFIEEGLPYNLVVKAKEIKFEEFGEHSLDLYVDNQLTARLPMSVISGE
jgi:hypothetical protein